MMTLGVLPPAQKSQDHALVDDLQGHMFGARLKQAREEAQLSQEALAEAIGVVRRTVASYEAGTKSPRLDRLSKIAQVLGRSPGWFLQTKRPTMSPPMSKLDQMRRDVRRLRRDVQRLIRIHQDLMDRMNRETP